MVQEFPGQARFVEENYGESELARRFGVTRYPAIFVNDVLAATPNDFGFYGKGPAGGGRYAPIREAEGQNRFRSDLEQMIRLLLERRENEARAMAAKSPQSGLTSWPNITLHDLDGRPIRAEDLRGRAVVLELWATWCPPCRGTLRWLGEMKQRYGDRLAVVAMAIESDSTEVRTLTRQMNLPFRWVMGTPESVRAFGDVSAVPTLHLFNRSGAFVESYFGAPPDLHPRAEAQLTSLTR
ncbi:MAG: TlpA family protein disulfide reductase [Candidatus Eiseniibacteriota bacterium]